MSCCWRRSARPSCTRIAQRRNRAMRRLHRGSSELWLTSPGSRLCAACSTDSAAKPMACQCSRGGGARVRSGGRLRGTRRHACQSARMHRERRWQGHRRGMSGGQAPFARLNPTQGQLHELRQKHGPAFERWWRERFCHTFDCLTQSDARYLARSPDVGTMRNRHASAVREGNRGGGSAGPCGV